VDWIHLASGRVKRGAFVNIVIKLMIKKINRLTK
jgi:hypothetical protein